MREEVNETILQAVETATGLRLCLKIFGQGLPSPPRAFALHTSPFCLGVKETRNARCRECDLRRVPLLCEKTDAPFVHLCHAGASEVIIPVRVHGQLAAIGFLGQFRQDDHQPESLPFFPVSREPHLLAMASLLKVYLGDLLHRPRFASETSTGYRREAILRYLNAHLSQGPSLSDLAGHLHLSATRTAHSVRETFGVSFLELRDTLRLERATHLLQATYHKVAHIATECGFSSPNYFHRFFRGKTGLTPAAFRRHHRPSES